MEVAFSKYHGAGNDFVMIDDRDLTFPKENRVDLVQKICKRNFGVGSDGLILIQNDKDHDFYMEFYNPDGSQSFCGNGSRCAVMFVFHLGMISETCSFNSIHGINEAKITGDEVTLKMFDVQGIEKGEDYHYINTGSPHYNIYIDDVQALDLIPFARNIRYNDRFKAEGTNVNVIQEMDESNIMVRTYERGVEGETLSCGTGVTACAISQLIKHNKLRGAIKIQTKGGNLEVSVETIMTNVVKGIKLTGPAMFVFKGRMNV